MAVVKPFRLFDYAGVVGSGHALVGSDDQNAVGIIRDCVFPAAVEEIRAVQFFRGLEEPPDTAPERIEIRPGRFQFFSGRFIISSQRKVRIKALFQEIRHCFFHLVYPDVYVM